MRQLLCAVTIAFVFCLFLSVAQADPDWKKDFNSDDQEVRSAAYEALKNTEAQAEALEVLTTIYDKELSSYERSVSSLRNFLPGYGKGGDEALHKMFDRWLKARQAAYDLYWDLSVFPYPPQQRVTGPEEGYDVVTPPINATTSLYDKMIKKPIMVAAKKAASPRFADSIADVDADAALLAERSAVLAELDPEHVAFEAANLDFVRAAGLLGSKEYEDAVKLFSGLSEMEQTAFFFLHGQAIARWNQENPNGHSGATMTALVALNEFRIGLGMTALQTSKELFEAVNKHDAWCGGTISHQGEGGSMPADRCKAAGYIGSVNENMASAGSVSGVRTWRYDAGHFRTMVDPKYKHAGFSARGLNVGAGMPLGVPAIVPKWLESHFAGRMQPGQGQPPRR